MAASAQQATPRAPYLNPALPTQQRVDDLVGRMTLDEKDHEQIAVFLDGRRISSFDQPAVEAHPSSTRSSS